MNVQYRRGFKCNSRSLQVDLFSKSLLLVPVHLEVHWCLVAADNIRKRVCLYDSQGNALQKVARVTTCLYGFVPCFGSFYFYSFYPCYASLLPECPEILDDGSKREEADSFWKRLDGLLWWGAAIVQPFLPSLTWICYIRELSNIIWRTAELKWCFVAPCCPTQEMPQQSNENDCGVFVLEVQTSALHSCFFFFTHSSCPHRKMPLSQYSRCLTLGKPLNFSQRDIPKIRKRIYKELCDCKIHLQDWREGVLRLAECENWLDFDPHTRARARACWAGAPVIIISDQWWTQPYLLNFLFKWTCVSV